MNQNKKIPDRAMAILPLRGLNIFPGMLLSFDVERPISLAALNYAQNSDQEIFLITQKDISNDMPELNDLYEYGVVCRIRQLVRQPGGKLCKVMAEGIYRGRISSLSSDQPYFFGDIESVPDKPEKVAADRKEALMRTTVGLFDEYVQLVGSMPPEMLLNLVVSRDPAFVADYTAQNVRFDYRQKQVLLEELHPCRRLEMLIEMLNHELNVISIEQELNEATNEQVNRSQRDYYLREQMKIIQQELGEDDTTDDIGEYR